MSASLVGSEMCIRDRSPRPPPPQRRPRPSRSAQPGRPQTRQMPQSAVKPVDRVGAPLGSGRG
eukprot:9367320-Alexandrium_andersonii.AAC.1